MLFAAWTVRFASRDASMSQAFFSGRWEDINPKCWNNRQMTTADTSRHQQTTPDISLHFLLEMVYRPRIKSHLGILHVRHALTFPVPFVDHGDLEEEKASKLVQSSSRANKVNLRMGYKITDIFCHLSSQFL